MAPKLCIRWETGYLIVDYALFIKAFTRKGAAPRQKPYMKKTNARNIFKTAVKNGGWTIIEEESINGV